MFTKTSQNSYFSLVAQGDPAGALNTYRFYGASDSFLAFTRLVSPQLSYYGLVFTGTVGGVTTSLNAPGDLLFLSDAVGDLGIEFRNIVKRFCAMTDDGSVRVNIDLYNAADTAPLPSKDTLEFFCITVPGISRYDISVPYDKDATDIPAAIRNYILPPNVIIAPPTGVDIVIESDVGEFSATTWKNLATNATISESGPRNNEIVFTASGVKPQGIKLEQLTKTKIYRFEDFATCGDAVLVRWKSLTGATRQHVFPVLSQMREWEGEGLLGKGDGLPFEKNAVTGVQCRLCGLTRYGYWYYMDLLTSSEVHAVALAVNLPSSDCNAMIVSPFSLCTVEGGTPETPTGHGFFNFDFTLKMKHYDTF